jgi:hypothetical protein
MVHVLLRARIKKLEKENQELKKQLKAVASTGAVPNRTGGCAGFAN